jgi:hypothetical protein
MDNDQDQDQDQDQAQQQDMQQQQQDIPAQDEASQQQQINQQDMPAQGQDSQQQDMSGEDIPDWGSPSDQGTPGQSESSPIDALNAQNEQLLQQNMQIEQQYETLINEITWERIVKFLKKDKFVSFLVSATVDDLENKMIVDEKKNSDLEYMNTIINTINQVLANVNNNPKFADIYCSMFSMSLDNFDQTKSQRDAIDNFLTEVKSYAKQLAEKPPQQPQPSPEDMKNQAAAQELQAKAKLLEVQAQEVASKLQGMSQGNDGQAEVQANEQDAAQRMQEIQLKYQQEMQLQQAKIAADNNRARERMAADKQLLDMKIQADKERYAEKIKADYIAKNVNNDAGEGSEVPPVGY